MCILNFCTHVCFFYFILSNVIMCLSLVLVHGKI